MAAAGDMVTTLSLDDYEYVTGLRNAAAETNKFAHASAESSNLLGEHHHLHRAAHKATHLAMAASFAMTSGEGEDKLVGSLEKASMLLPMIGMQFGGVGTAIGVTGGIFATALLGPIKLLNDQAKEFGEALKRAGSQWDKLISQRGSAVAFEQKLGAIDETTSPQAIEEMQKAEKDQMEQKLAMLDEAEKKQKALAAAAKQAKEIQEGGFGGGLLGAIKGIGDWTGLTDNGAEADKRAKAANEALAKSNEQVADLKREAQEHKERAEQLGEKLEPARKNEEEIAHEKEMNDLLEKRRQIAQKIGEESLNPLEKALKKQEEINTAYALGDLTQKEFEAASAKLQRDIMQPTTGHLNAAAVGSAAQYNAIRESIRSQETPGVAELKTLVELGKRQLAIQENVAKPDPGIKIP